MDPVIERDFSRLVEAGLLTRVIDSVKKDVAFPKATNFVIAGVGWVEETEDEDGNIFEPTRMVDVVFDDGGQKVHLGFQVVDGAAFGAFGEQSLTEEQYALVCEFAGPEPTKP